MYALSVGIEALKRQDPLAFVPWFWIVNFTATRERAGIVVVATKLDVEVLTK